MLNILLDTNVLFSNWTLDAILSLADDGSLYPRWSNVILDEFVEATKLKGRSELSERIIGHINRAYPHALISLGESEISEIALPDPDDRHVVAAALEGGCDCIVTFNVRDFPRYELRKLGLEVLHPDELLVGLAEDEPEAMLEVIQTLVSEKERPPRTMKQEIEGLRRCGLPRFADWLEAEAL